MIPRSSITFKENYQINDKINNSLLKLSHVVFILSIILYLKILKNFLIKQL